VVTGIPCEFGIQSQQEVHAAVRFGPLKISEWPGAWQIKVVLEDERAQSSVNLLPKRLEARHLAVEPVVDLGIAFQQLRELRHVAPGSVDKDNIGFEIPEVRILELHIFPTTVVPDS